MKIGKQKRTLTHSHKHKNNNNQNHLTRYEFNRKLINRSLSNIEAYRDQTGFLIPIIITTSHQRQQIPRR